MRHRPSTHGFTLVELLVVIAIMAMLFGLILAGGRSTAGNDTRRVARQIAAVLLSAQSRAIGSRLGAAVLFESDGDPSRLGQPSTNADPKNDRAIRVRDADMAPAITAEVISPFQPPSPSQLALNPTQAVQVPSFRPDLWVVAVPTPPVNPPRPPIVPENASLADLKSGFRIRFTARDFSGSPWSSWYGFLPSGEDLNGNGTMDQGEDLAYGPTLPPDGSFCTDPLVRLRSADGQTPANSVWPAAIQPPSPPTDPPRYRIEVSRYPGIGTTALEVPETVAVDLRYSGHGDDPSPNSTWGRLASKGVIGVSFDTVGRIDLLMQNVTGVGLSQAVQPLAPTQSIYFFIVARDDLESEVSGGPSTLSSERTAWLVIDPQSGRVSIAANEPQTINPGTPPTLAQLRAARRLARLASSVGN